jgi:hypothetical protein
MNDIPGTQPPPRRLGMKVALVGAGIAVGAIAATAVGASATTTTSGSGSASGSTSSGAPAAPAGPRPHDGGCRPGGPAPVRSDEKSLGSALTAKLRAAALKAVPGGTVHRIETDAGDGTYEAHMTRSDGSPVTVKFDKSGGVTKVEDGMGTGDPGPHR